MLKKRFILFLCVFLLFSFTACEVKNVGEAESDMVKVSVSFHALKELTEAVGGDKIEVSTIVPDGAEPHDFEPRARDMVSLSAADVFIYNGLGMEPWVEMAVSAAANDKLITVNASAGVEIIENNDMVHEHGQYDPHIWLSVICAQTITTNIKDALVRADYKNRNYYEENCSEFNAKLQKLYDEYSEKFNSVDNKTFVTGHAAFAYLCRDFGLKQNSVENTFAKGEPSAQQLAELVVYCLNNNIRTVFAEEMASPQVSETLANEVGAKVEKIYTMASTENGATYLERMEDNLKRIYESLSK